MAGLEIRSPTPKANFVLVSVNPGAGARSGGDQVARLQGLLEQEGYQVQVTSDLAEMQNLSAAAMDEERLRVVVAAGGDGTIARILNETAPGIPLTILPLGTENLLSKYLSIKACPESVAQLIHQGWTVDLDVGSANGTLFTLMLGCGFDAEVVRRLDNSRSGHIRHLSYLKPIVETILDYDYPQIKVSFPGGEDGVTVSSLSACWAFVVNLPRYAGGLKLVPGASGTDGQLDVCTFRRGSFLNGLRYLTGVVLGKHHHWSDCDTRQATRIRLESDRLVSYQLDGDPGGELPVEVEVLPGRMTVMVPRPWIDSQQAV